MAECNEAQLRRVCYALSAQRSNLEAAFSNAIAARPNHAASCEEYGSKLSYEALSRFEFRQAVMNVADLELSFKDVGAVMAWLQPDPNVYLVPSELWESVHHVVRTGTLPCSPHRASSRVLYPSSTNGSSAHQEYSLQRHKGGKPLTGAVPAVCPDPVDKFLHQIVGDVKLRSPSTLPLPPSGSYLAPPEIHSPSLREKSASKSEHSSLSTSTQELSFRMTTDAESAHWTCPKRDPRSARYVGTQQASHMDNVVAATSETAAQEALSALRKELCAERAAREAAEVALAAAQLDLHQINSRGIVADMDQSEMSRLCERIASLQVDLESQQELYREALEDAAEMRRALMESKQEYIDLKDGERVRMEELMQREERLLQALLRQLETARSDGLSMDHYSQEMDRVYTCLERLHTRLKQRGIQGFSVLSQPGGNSHGIHPLGSPESMRLQLQVPCTPNSTFVNVSDDYRLHGASSMSKQQNPTSDIEAEACMSYQVLVSDLDQLRNEVSQLL
mmetsp:Transcript_38600/g.73973  ORF Transcript_38600/g.73973 Transcript_38600/m.73973 type:complete len:508 (-) Transcript_38600:127-1650(-)